MAKKLTKKEIESLMKFDKHSVIKSVLKATAIDFIKDLETREEQDLCIEPKDITLKPLNDKEIKDLVMELIEAGYDGSSLFGISTSEKLDIIRLNSEIINEYIDDQNYNERINLDSESTTTELKWSSSKVWNFLVSNPQYMGNLD